MAASLRAALAPRRRGRGDRGHGADGAEPRVRGHRGGAAAERSLRGRRGRDPLRAFCTSRHISTGPSSSLAAVAGGAVVVTGLAGEEAAQLVAAIAVATGLLFLLLALLRMGWIASFLSKAVVTGFLAGAAVDVVIGELPKSPERPRTVTTPGASSDRGWPRSEDVHGTTLLVGATALAVILGFFRLAPAVPGALVLVAGGLLASYLDAVRHAYGTNGGRVELYAERRDDDILVRVADSGLGLTARSGTRTGLGLPVIGRVSNGVTVSSDAAGTTHEHAVRVAQPRAASKARPIVVEPAAPDRHRIAANSPCAGAAGPSPPASPASAGARRDPHATAPSSRGTRGRRSAWRRCGATRARSSTAPGPARGRSRARHAPERARARSAPGR